MYFPTFTSSSLCDDVLLTYVSFLMSVCVYKALRKRGFILAEYVTWRMDSSTTIFTDEQGAMFPARLELFPMTVAIHYLDRYGVPAVVHWMASDIVRLKDEAGAWNLRSLQNNGQHQYLSVRGHQEQEALKKQYRSYRFVGGTYYRLFGSTRSRLLWFLGVILALLMAAYFWWIPAIADRYARNVPVSYEKEIGAQLFENLKGTWDIDKERTRLMQEYYNELGYDKVYNTRVTVVRSPEKNAFAMPGGYIVVYSGILEEMPSADALSALLAHESAHILYRHTLRNIMQTMGRSMFLTLLTGNGSGVASTILSRADELKGLEYSRELETEADNEGLSMMDKRNINPEGMYQLMDYLREETAGKEPAAFMSTHPVFEKRMENIRAKISGDKKANNKDVKLENLFALLKNPAAGW